MPQNNPGRFQPKIFPQERGGVVAKLVWTPVVGWFPVLKFRVRHPFRSKRLLDGLGDGVAVDRDGIMLAGHLTWILPDIRPDVIALIPWCFAIGKVFLPPFGHRLSGRETIRLYLSKGGKVFLTGKSGIDDNGRFMFECGTEFFGDSEYAPDYILPEKQYCPDFILTPMVIYIKSQRI